MISILERLFGSEIRVEKDLPQTKLIEVSLPPIQPTRLDPQYIKHINRFYDKISIRKKRKKKDRTYEELFTFQQQPAHETI